MPDIDQAKLEPLVQLRARLDSFALSATIRRKLGRIWATRTKIRISDRQAEAAKERAEAKDLALSLARRMRKKHDGSTAQKSSLKRRD